jgi:hypothetical protein
MLGGFAAVWACGHFPLEVAFGAVPLGPKRVPDVTAFADPANVL